MIPDPPKQEEIPDVRQRHRDKANLLLVGMWWFQLVAISMVFFEGALSYSTCFVITCLIYGVWNWKKAKSKLDRKRCGQ